MKLTRPQMAMLNAFPLDSPEQDFVIFRAVGLRRVHASRVLRALEQAGLVENPGFGQFYRLSKKGLAARTA